MAAKKKTSKKPKEADQEALVIPDPADEPPAAAAAPERIERRRYKEKLPCAIAPELVVLKADEMAAVYRKTEQLKLEKRDALADFRDRKAHFEEQLSELSTAVEQHTVTRDVECIEYLVRGQIEIYRADTDELLKTKAATGEDLQESIFAKGDAARSAAPALVDEPAPPTDDGLLAEAFGVPEAIAEDLGEPIETEDWSDGPNPKPLSGAGAEAE